MVRPRLTAGALVAAVVTMLALLAPIPASGNANGLPDGAELVADGFDNPRGLHVDTKGRVYVAEAGRGGDTLAETVLGGSPEFVCVGATGRISRIRRGNVETLVDGLPSAASAIGGSCDGAGEEATGPQGVSSEGKGSHVSYSIGIGGDPADRDVIAGVLPEGAELGFVQQTNRNQPNDVDLLGFEAAANPAGGPVDSNPFGLLRVGGATTVAVDSGGNSLLALRGDQVTEVLATFTFICMPWPFGPNPIPPDANPCEDPNDFPADPVPTDVARHRSGDYLVSVLGGFPFIPGFSVVFRVDRNHAGPALCSTEFPGQGCSIFADGLTALIGIDIDRNDRVYVAQFADDGILTATSGLPGADQGSIRVLDDRTGEQLSAVTGFRLPGGIAIRGRDVYVSVGTIDVGTGQVARIPRYCDSPSRCPIHHS